MLPVINLGEFRRTITKLSSYEIAYCDSYRICTQPYVHAFVYHPRGAVLIKGMSQHVDSYISMFFPKSIYNLVYYKGGNRRGGWRSPKNLGIYFIPETVGKQNKYKVKILHSLSEYEVLEFRNVPKKWLPEYDKAITR